MECSCDICNIKYSFVNREFSQFFDINTKGDLVSKRKITFDDLKNKGLIDDSDQIVAEIRAELNGKMEKLRLILTFQKNSPETTENISSGK